MDMYISMETKPYYRELLESELDKRIDANSTYSLRAFAKRLGVDPGALSKILNGKKLITFELAEKITLGLQLDPEQKHEFFTSVASSFNGEKRKRKPLKLKSFLKDSKLSKPKDLTLDLFRTISDWYHYAILQLIKTSNFQHSSKDISKKLGISQMQSKQALKRLEELELIKTEDGKLFRTNHQITTGDLSITGPAFKKRIQQITDKSIESLLNDPIELRNHTTMTMAIDPEKIPLAKEMIQEFMDELSEALETKNEKVYELQINLFPLEE